MRQESGTEAERLSYDTTGLPVLSTWEVTSGPGHGSKYTWGGSAWVQTHSGGAALVSVANAIISEVWAGAGTTNAPDATDYANFIIGVNNGGASTANVYHVINGAWVDTGATVANLYGG